MRYANNFNPEWGYLAPAPGFTRTARIALVAAAVGASAGGAVVFSLLEAPPAAETSVAARTLVQPADAGVSAAQAAQAHPQAGPALQPPVLQPQVQTRSQPEMRTSDMRTVVHRPVLQSSPSAHVASPAGSEAGTAATAAGPASIAGLVEAPAAIDTPAATALSETAATPDGALAQKKVARRPALTWRSPRGEQAYAGNRGPLALLPSFPTPATPGTFQRGDY